MAMEQSFNLILLKLQNNAVAHKALPAAGQIDHDRVLC
jgi:hypothetical protein